MILLSTCSAKCSPMPRAIVRRSTSTPVCSARKDASSAAAANTVSGSFVDACARIVAACMRFATSCAKLSFERAAASLPMASSSGVPSRPMRNSAFAFSSATKPSGALEHPVSASPASLGSSPFGSASASSASAGSSCARNGVPSVAGPASVGEKYCTDSMCTAPCSMPAGKPVAGRRVPASSTLMCRSAKSGHRSLRSCAHSKYSSRLTSRAFFFRTLLKPCSAAPPA